MVVEYLLTTRLKACRLAFQGSHASIIACIKFNIFSIEGIERFLKGTNTNLRV